MYDFGDGRVNWFFGCPMGYHQIEVNERSRPMLAFAGPDANLYTFRVMPFGVVNGPKIFIRTAHDISREWQERAKAKRVKIDRDTSSRLIVDDIYNHTKDMESALTYMEAQLEVAALRRLSLTHCNYVEPTGPKKGREGPSTTYSHLPSVFTVWPLSLLKSSFFVERVEFVSVDISPSGNMPACSKHDLLRKWPRPKDIRHVATFIAFGMFYMRMRWISWFEM